MSRGLGNLSIHSDQLAERGLGAFGCGFCPGSKVTTGTPGALDGTQRRSLGLVTSMLHGPTDLIALLAIADVVPDTGTDGENEYQPHQAREESATFRLTHGVPSGYEWRKVT